MMPLGCSVLLWAAIFGFIAVMLPALVNPVRDTLAALVHCPGASEVSIETSDGGTVRQFGSSPMRTTVFEMTCAFPDGTSRVVGNDTAVLTAFGISIAGGALLGGLFALFGRLRRG
jgi:hypothetical protein